MYREKKEQQMIIEIYISEYLKMIKNDTYDMRSLGALKYNIGRRIPKSIAKKGFEDAQKILREINKDKPGYTFIEDIIDLEFDVRCIEVKWAYSEEELERFSELINELKKLFNLKRTEFIIDPNIFSECKIDKIITCYSRSEEDIIHEGVHAFFEERRRRLLEQLGEEQYQNKIKNIVPDRILNEITARLIDNNFQGTILTTCSKKFNMVIRNFVASQNTKYKNIELGKKIMRLYGSMYEFYCVCPEDNELYKNIKNDIDPLIVYNKLARYVGTHELLI